ncbi:hypothetical protein Peur_016224 [Populus x canadensis]
MSIVALIGSALLLPLLVAVSICRMGWLGSKGKSHSEGENVHCLESALTLDLPKFVTPPVYKIFFLAKAIACLIPRVCSGNNSTGRSSNVVSYDVLSRDEDAYGIFEDCSSN